MHYINKSCDLLKARMGAILTAYISRSCDLPKKEILVAYISSFKIVLDRISQKGDLIAYINRPCGLLKRKFPF